MCRYVSKASAMASWQNAFAVADAADAEARRPHRCRRLHASTRPMSFSLRTRVAVAFGLAVLKQALPDAKIVALPATVAASR